MRVRQPRAFGDNHAMSLRNRCIAARPDRALSHRHPGRPDARRQACAARSRGAQLAGAAAMATSLQPTGEDFGRLDGRDSAGIPRVVRRLDSGLRP